MKVSMREVEVIKLGDVLGSEGTKNPFILIITDGGEIVDHYNEILTRNCKDDYKIQRTIGGVVQERFGDVDRGKRSGMEDGYPVIGESYTLDNGIWHTSSVNRIIEGCVLITRNSIYAIHNLSEFRDKKLNELGI
jgi:hypothetical protein